MKKFYLQTLMVLSIVSVNPIFAQNFTETPEYLNANSRWIFGHNAGLDFNSGSPIPMLTEMDTWEGPSSLSDPTTGDLLFYSNGEDCRNATGNIMPNGDSLLGNSSYSTFNPQPLVNKRSARQGTCIVPVLGEANKYYLFSLAGPSASSSDMPNYALGSLFYSVVDMSLDNGLGDIVSGMKNIPLSYDTLMEAMIAIPGDNCDIWLILHALQKPEIWAYHITADGIDTIPVISDAGVSMPPLFLQFGSIATLTVSPDREMIARSGGIFVPTIIAHFDPSTGEVSDVIQLPGDYHVGGDVCFSPDNSKLYVGDSPYGLGQFDVSVYDSATIVSSLVSVGSRKSFDLKLYGDTIYFMIPNIDSIHRINAPNLSGQACDVEYSAFSLVPSTEVRSGFSGDVVFSFPPDTLLTLALDTLICPRTELTLTSPQTTFDSIYWSDGSSNSSLTVTQAGTYWVLQTNGCHYRADTFIVETYDFPEPVITVNVLELGTVATYNTYQWLLNGVIIPNATQSTYTVLENGDYQVIVTNGSGCIDTSDIYVVTNAEDNAIDELEALAGKIHIYPNPAKDIVYVNTPVRLNLSLVTLEGKVIKHVEKSSQIYLQGIAEGVYFLKVYDQYNRLIKTEKVIKTSR